MAAYELNLDAFVEFEQKAEPQQSVEEPKEEETMARKIIRLSETGEKVMFDTATDAAIASQLKQKQVYQRINKKAKSFSNGYKFYYADEYDEAEEAEINLRYQRYSKQNLISWARGTKSGCVLTRYDQERIYGRLEGVNHLSAIVVKAANESTSMKEFKSKLMEILS